ncbi:uncharacterized protein LOC135495649 isoform X2 [Lineus longissimus]|uniref:uncharacterized protein LOC135495649 isoform X2 n=1 Tax=Lineus longissimus TaxID=88925 RepID=UPI00315D258E
MERTQRRQLNSMPKRVTPTSKLSARKQEGQANMPMPIPGKAKSPATHRTNTLKKSHHLSPSPSLTSMTFFGSSDSFSESPKEVNFISAPIIPIEVQQNPLGVLDARRGSTKSATSLTSEEEMHRITRQDSISKTGDMERLVIFEQVKSGRMTIEDALKFADDHGLVSSAKRENEAIADTTSALAEQKCYNFAVYKKGRFQSQIRRILQIDFRNKVISNIQKGNVIKKYDFAQVHDFDSKEGDVNLKIFFNDDSDLDMDADSPEEKNEIMRLLSVIIKLNTADARMEKDFTEALPQLQTIIKEGQLEKKGKGFISWVKRWVRVRHGEVSYYRPGEETALNIIQLAEGTTAVTKVEHNGFIIIGKIKQFAFRVPAEHRTPAEVKQDRDNWIKVILEANHGGKSMLAPLSPLLSPRILEHESEKPTLDIKFNLHQLCEELAAMKQQLKTLQVPEDVLGQADRVIQMAEMIEVAPIGERPNTGSGAPAEGPAAMDDKKLYAEINKRLSQHMSGTHYSRTDICSKHEFDEEGNRIAGSTVPRDEIDDEKDPGYDTVGPPDPVNTVKVSDWSMAVDASEVPPQDRLQPVPAPRSRQPTKPVVAPVKLTEDLKAEDGSESKVLVDTQKVEERLPLPQPTESSVPPPPGPGGAPPPPPLSGPGFFSMLMQGSGKKLKQTSKIKLRAFHWNKVPKNLCGKSMWKSADDLTDKLDIKLLEDVFTAGGDVPQTPTAKTPKNTPKTLLDPKRCQNLDIVLMGLKMSVSQLESKLNFIKKSEGALPLEQICMLRRLQPTSDDIQMYKNYKGKRESLQTADQFLIQLGEIPNLNLRLDALVAIMELPAQFDELGPTVTNMNEACGELISSQKFLTVLEYVLAVGNILNQSSKKDVADGFQLASLTKLADLKGKDRKFSLLQFVIEQMAKHNEGLLKFHEELSHVEACCDISIKGLNAEIEVMQRDLNKIEKNAKILKKSRGSVTVYDNKFQQDVQDYVAEYERKVKTLNDTCLKTQIMYKKTLEFFGENPEKDSEEFFSCLAEFIKKFKQLVTEYEKAKNPGNPRGALASAMMRGVPHHSMMKENKSFDMGMLNSANIAKGTGKDHPTMEGYLEKLSGGKHWGAKWDKRWFEVSSTGHLHYYKKKFDKNLGSVYLHRSPIKIDEEDDTVIFIDTEERDFKIKAKSAEEAQEWFKVLGYYGIKQ